MAGMPSRADGGQFEPGHATEPSADSGSATGPVRMVTNPAATGSGITSPGQPDSIQLAHAGRISRPIKTRNPVPAPGREATAVNANDATLTGLATAQTGSK